MVTVTYASLHSLLNLTTSNISAINTENLIDMAINMLNLYGDLSISAMSGSSGSKTVTLTSAEWAAVFLVCRALYYSGYKGPDSASIAGLSYSPADLLSNPNVMVEVKHAASQLRARTMLRT